jgi:hypothetical protein
MSDDLSANKYLKINSFGKVHRKRRVLLKSRSLGATTIGTALKKYYDSTGATFVKINC